MNLPSNSCIFNTIFNISSNECTIEIPTLWYPAEIFHYRPLLHLVHKSSVQKMSIRDNTKKQHNSFSIDIREEMENV